MEILKQIALLVVGFLLLIKGADYFVEGASKIADKFHIPQIVIGLTIVAFGTSAPEAAVGIAAGLHGNADIALGNVLGSNVMNILLILGITSVITPVAIQMTTMKYEVPFVIIISAIIGILGYFGGSVSFVDGLILWALFILFFIYLIKLSKSGKAVMDDVPESDADESLLKLIVITVLGMAAIIIGSQVTVDSASALAKIFGMSERLIGLTIVAFGTSLPELITSVTAALKGKTDIAIGNIVGSNIFNILFVLGTTALIVPLNYSADFIFDNVLCVVSALLLLVCVLRNKKLTRVGGSIMLLVYAAYLVRLFTI